jgi:hypothetical protein
VVAGTLGIVVVALGLSRNLSETTRNGLPRFGADGEGATPTPGLYEGGGEPRPRRQPSPRQLRWFALFALLLALVNVAFAVFSPDARVFHACFAALFALSALLHWRRSRSSRAGPPPPNLACDIDHT